MSSFSTSIFIAVPPEKVWEVLADIGNIYVWNPGVENSHLISDKKQGLGAERYCDLGGGNYLNETVVVWTPNQALTMRITHTNLPFKTVDIRFTLREERGGTVVEVSPIYELKYGVVGKILDASYVKKTYESGMKDLLLGLKEYIED